MTNNQNKAEKEELRIGSPNFGFIAGDEKPMYYDKNLRYKHLCSLPQSNTLGTAMEERFKEKFNGWILQDSEEHYRSFEIIINFINKELSQSKTDLLNALIEREEKDKDIIERGVIGFNEQPFAQGRLMQIDDTINHLKSLRDEK